MVSFLQKAFKSIFLLFVLTVVSLHFQKEGNASVYDSYQPFSIACPFYTVFDSIQEHEFIGLWKHGEPIQDKINVIMVIEEDVALLQERLGTPNDEKVRVTSKENVTDILGEKKGSVCAVVPVQSLQPNWKRIALDELPAPWDHDYAPSDDLLAMPVSDPDLIFDLEKSATLLMTGTTALSRTTAYKMALNGILYPAEKISTTFAESDLRHISNESAFWNLCPEPVLNGPLMQFCTPASYLKLFTHLDISVIELSGNHLRDYDWPPLLETFELLEEAGIPYYAAGRTVEEAKRPLFLSYNGHNFAFLGCNIAGPEHVYVTNQLPGVSRCNYDEMVGQIEDLKKIGYLVVVTLQYYETYSRVPTEMQLEDFQRLSEAGAVIVSGSQAHYPQIMEPTENGFIHYGLGNLFFDQMDRPVHGTRQEFLDRYVFYDGRLLQVELITAILEDYAQPRLMTQDEREMFLEMIFSYVTR